MEGNKVMAASCKLPDLAAAMGGGKAPVLPELHDHLHAQRLGRRLSAQLWEYRNWFFSDGDKRDKG